MTEQEKIILALSIGLLIYPFFKLIKSVIKCILSHIKKKIYYIFYAEMEIRDKELNSKIGNLHREMNEKLWGIARSIEISEQKNRKIHARCYVSNDGSFHWLYPGKEDFELSYQRKFARFYAGDRHTKDAGPFGHCAGEVPDMWDEGRWIRPSLRNKTGEK